MKTPEPTPASAQSASQLSFTLPDYDTTFTFSVHKNGETIFDDGNKMPHELRLLLTSAPSLLAERDRLREVNAELVEALERITDDFQGLARYAKISIAGAYEESLAQARAVLARAQS